MSNPTWDGSNTIPVEFVEWIQRQRRAVNHIPTAEITWTRDGEKIAVSDKQLEDFKFTGLNNVDFVTTYLPEIENTAVQEEPSFLETLRAHTANQEPRRGY